MTVHFDSLYEYLRIVQYVDELYASIYTATFIVNRTGEIMLFDLFESAHCLVIFRASLLSFDHDDIVVRTFLLDIFAATVVINVAAAAAAAAVVMGVVVEIAMLKNSVVCTFNQQRLF